MADSKPVVAFLGPNGTYTHQATLQRFLSSTYTLLPKRTISDVFTSVSTHATPLGVVPFENSTNGSVVTTLDLLASPKHIANIRIIGEIYLPVHHALCVSPTLISASAVKKLYSHPQAWGQCTKFLSTEPWKRVEKQDVSSTSRGAEMVAAEGPGSTSAAISSAIAGELHGLRVLEDGIEDVSGNCTRFLVLGPSDAAEDGSEPAGRDDNDGDGEEERDDFKTLVVFTVSHSEPGALADCLAVFKRFGLNLTSINTRPSGQTAWHYVFYVEIVGKKLSGDDDGKVNEALRELGKVAREKTWMGSWENGLLPG